MKPDLDQLIKEVEHRAELAKRVHYAGNVSNAKSAMDVPRLVKALREAVNEIERRVDPGTAYRAKKTLSSILTGEQDKEGN